jgi:DNA polymerase-3 subunit gamma/tau
LKEQVTAVATPEASVVLAMAAEPMGLVDSATPIQPISENLLRRVWKDYALQKKLEGKNSLHATLVAKEPTLAEPRVIAFSIVNEVQEKYLREERPELLSYLRRELGDPGLDLRVEKEEITDLRPRYTPKDRFAIMAERNPALLGLKEKLGLDLG